MRSSPAILDTVPRSTWETTDSKAVADALGLPWQTVAYYRKKRGLPAVRKAGSGRPRVLDTSGFDSSQSNAWNARNLGCTPTYAARIRARLNNNKQEDWC